MTEQELTVVGGGLAGCEAAWQAAQRGVNVRLYEMRPLVSTGAHKTDLLAELVCSNSLGSSLRDRPAGLLQAEARRLGSLLVRTADECAVPAGRALAVDRALFSERIDARIRNHPRITIVQEEAAKIPEGTALIASGPLTSARLGEALRAWTGEEDLAFYDALAPIVSQDSIDFSIAFRASRYDTSERGLAGEYINCPFERDSYERFVDALLAAERIPLQEHDRPVLQGVSAGHRRFFEGCLPVEVLAERGRESLAFGPFRPAGVRDPRTGRRPYAVVQLRQDNLAGSLFSLVGFQTNLKHTEQARVLRMIPGLENAEIVRYGQMHRNTFLFSPAILHATMQTRRRESLFFAGQITGVEGYVGSIATGLLAGWNAARYLTGKELLRLPESTMLGALCRYITKASAADFQPMKANFGLLPPLALHRRSGKRERAALRSERALTSLEEWINAIED